MTYSIGVDVGGTKIAAGVVDEKGAIVARTRRDTPSRDVAGIVGAIVAVTRELAADHDVDVVGVGCAGFIDAGRSRVMFAPNLAWRDLPLRDDVGAATGLPVVVENDANAAAWGEFRFGAAEDVDDMVLLTVGTGVGGAVILDGELHRGANGIAGELGHMRLVPDGQYCGCGLRGCVEAYASGTALVRNARAAAQGSAAFPGSPERLLDLAGGDAQAITGPMVTQAAQDGDPLARHLIAELAGWLGAAMGSFVSIFDPGAFVIGGGVADAGELLLEPAQEALWRNITGGTHRPFATVRLATLGNDAGIVGAADLARI
ncbi:ROK family glucokinase [Phytoactinopolyspora halotolerans]|uniref:Glucokinase n=1 Tax=Phytoactinopolyspora halotolerans TaxID=1981512 RepID=A0A6L9S9P0_9ACTN|nr:ROK family glucokinase [Phytoactinopolyspora halotolerans]NEE01799.1 ROK family glucokinase [Phytoactinopolyspora halotolerans]